VTGNPSSGRKANNTLVLDCDHPDELVSMPKNRIVGVTSALPGRTAVTDRWKTEPHTAVTAIAEGLRVLHNALSASLKEWAPLAGL
jgi:hypothetical protein